MSRDRLQEASDHLREAAVAATGDSRERLYEQSNQFAELATADRGPDHGRLARHLHTLRETRENVGTEPADHIDAAIKAIQDYRESVEGV